MQHKIQKQPLLLLILFTSCIRTLTSFIQKQPLLLLIKGIAGEQALIVPEFKNNLCYC